MMHMLTSDQKFYTGEATINAYHHRAGLETDNIWALWKLQFSSLSFYIVDSAWKEKQDFSPVRTHTENSFSGVPPWVPLWRKLMFKAKRKIRDAELSTQKRIPELGAPSTGEQTDTDSDLSLHYTADICAKHMQVGLTTLQHSLVKEYFHFHFHLRCHSVQETWAQKRSSLC